MKTPSSPSLDILDLLKDGRHFAEKRDAKIHIIDSITGLTKAVLSSATQAHTPVRLVERDLGSHKVLVEEGINSIQIGRELAYSPVIIDLLCQKIAEGGSLTTVCGEQGFPSYNVLCRWRREHPSIDEQLEMARRDRGEYLRDKAVAEAAAAEGRDPISGPTLRVDTYKWAAGVDNGRYSPKAKVEATINTPTQIIVHTGIDRTKEVTELAAATTLESTGG